MFGVDFSEILLIFGIALVVLGPQKLPKLANTIGRWIGRARAMARQFREQLEQESQTLHDHMDLGPEFSSRPGARPGNGGATPRPTANSSTTPGEPQPRIDPRPMGPPSPLQPTPAAGSEPAAPMTGPPLPEMGLADTHPAAFHPYQPPPITEPPPVSAGTSAPTNGSAAASASAPASTTSSPADADTAGTAQAAGEADAQDPTFPAPHQTAFWPPDGRL